jgi:hypothetical protein
MDVLCRWSSNEVVASWDDVGEIDRPSHFRQKTMLMIFFNCTREYKIAIVPE